VTQKRPFWLLIYHERLVEVMRELIGPTGRCTQNSDLQSLDGQAGLLTGLRQRLFHCPFPIMGLNMVSFCPTRPITRTHAILDKRATFAKRSRIPANRTGIDADFLERVLFTDVRGAREIAGASVTSDGKRA
jgi:hypothetical protein